MNEKFEKYLPIGSVVLMKEATKRIMITGYAVKSPQLGNKVFDYIGCLYPEGMVSSDRNLLFDHKDIQQIFAIGFSDDEQKKFVETLKKVVEAQEKEANNPQQ